MNPVGLAAVQGRDAAPRAGQRRCPACGQANASAPLETFHESQLFQCDRCELHFWHPAKMPDAAWYERVYGHRDNREMPLEPGHRFFLSDPKAPKRGKLLDLGCGVGNFLAAARDAGFDAAGLEFNQNAVKFAREHYRLSRVYALRPEDFRLQYPAEKFDVVTFFEVLEHQQDPQNFLRAAKELLAEGGFIALSVPNRDRWQKGTDTLDYPPNHLTRWSPRAIQNFLVRNGFEVLSLLKEPLNLARTAQVMSAGLRTGLVARVMGQESASFAEIGQLKTEEIAQIMSSGPSASRERLASRLVQWKTYAFLPAATVLFPYFRMKGYSGIYLYCLARLKTPAGCDFPAGVRGA